MKESVHKAWQKFLAPLVGAMITALGVYATAAQQQYSHDNDRRVTVMESRLRELETLKSDVKTLSAEVHELIGELRAARSMQLHGR
jgi:uncharacterized protein YlxW (UPF0749 family)